MTAATMAAEMVRVRVVFEEHRMLSKSKKKEGLKRCWLLLKPQLNTISDLSSHLQRAFSLHRTCPNGITLYMDGFVLPPFESTSILKDKDIICVKRKGSMLIDKPDTPISEPNGHQSIELPKLLSIEGPQDEEAGGYETDSVDLSDQLGDEPYAEPKAEANVISKKRKASKKLKSPSQKKMKLSSPDKLAVTPEVHEEEIGTPQDRTHNKLSLSKKENDKSSNLSSQKKTSNNLKSHKQSSDKSEAMHDEKRLPLPEGDGGSGTKKTPSRSARRKKAKRKWLREKLKSEKEKLHQSPGIEKDVQKSPVKNNCKVSNAQQSDEESEAEDDMVPVEIRPGHIRFQSLRKDQEAAQHNQTPVETTKWNGITSKKKGQKWGKESTWPRKQDAYEHSSQDYHTVQNVEKKNVSNAIDFDKLPPYTSLPKEGDVIAYRLMELSTSWTPELSSFRVGRITKYNATSNGISLEPVSEYPFEFKKKIDDDASYVQFDASPYEENGSLEIDYLSLGEVRMVNPGNSNSAAIAGSSNNWDNLISSINRTFADAQTAAGSSEPVNGVRTSAKENGGVNVWDEINEALTAKKAKLSQANSWGKEESSSSQSWSKRALRCSALGPTMALLRSQNGLK